jgi:DNA-binding NtrC family response regulator
VTALGERMFRTAARQVSRSPHVTVRRRVDTDGRTSLHRRGACCLRKAAAQAMVERCQGNKSEAAKILEISRKHLYTLLDEGKG